jgi:hypothetical protein
MNQLYLDALLLVLTEINASLKRLAAALEARK